MTRPICRWVLVVLVLGPAAWVRGQALADYVPNDVTVYVGWEGTAALGKSYDQSHLAAVIHDAGMPGLVTDMVHAVGAVVDKNQPGLRDLYDPFEELSPLIFRSKWAVYVRQPNAKNPEAVEIRILVQPVDDKDKERVSKVFARVVKLDPQSFRTDAAEGVVTLTAVERADKSPAFAGKIKRPLSGSERLKAGMADLPGPAGLVIHADMKKLIKAAARAEDMLESDADAIEALTGTATAPAETQPGKEPGFEEYMKAAGLDTVSSATVAGGFLGKDWYTHVFVEAPLPRHGFVGLLDAPGLAEPELMAAPLGSAVGVTAVRLDPAAVLEQTRKFLAVGGNASLNDFNGGWANMGVDLEKDVIGNFGSAWVVYSDPSVAIVGLGTGVCIVNEPKDPAKLQQVMEKFERFANGHGDPNNPQIQVVEQQGVKCYSMNEGFVSPSWAVADGRFYFSFSAQSVLFAVNAAKHPDKALVKGEKYQELVKRLGDHKPVAVQFMDLPASAGQMYQAYLLGLQTILPAFTEMGLPRGALVLPPLEKITPQLAPAGSAAWVDDRGLNALQIEPFPGAGFLNPHGVLNPAVVGTAVVGGWLMEWLSEGNREQDNLTDQARQVWTAVAASARDHMDWLGEDIGGLVRDYLRNPGVLLVSSNGHVKVFPGEYQGWSQEMRERWLRQNSSFVLIPGLKVGVADTPKVALFVRPEDAQGSLPATRLMVVYADGRTRWLPLDEGRETIKEQTGKTLEELEARQAEYKPGTGAPPTITPVPAPE